MTKTKFLVMSVVFALTYITCDVFFIFYIAGETDQTISTPAHSTSYKQTVNVSRSQYAFANQPDHNIQKEETKTQTIIE